jgi:exodeoxyribonuclease VII small subunit
MNKKNQSYAEAVAAIEEILQQIETGDLDVDELAEKVKQASELLKLCKGKLFQTEKEIGKILKEMEEGKESDE